MLTAILIVIGAAAAWLLVDRLRLPRGHAEWIESDRNRTFHSTGWEETMSPLEAGDRRAEPLSTRGKSTV